MFDVSLDIIANILSRLPVKSLMRFKCVCKPWHSVISGPHLAKLHLNRQEEEEGCHNRIIFSALSTNIFQSIDSETYCSDQSEAAVVEKTNLPWTEVNSLAQMSFIVCSCNGLLLYYKYKLVCESSNSFFLWNPSVKSYRKIPSPCLISDWTIYGICYDSSVDDYKLVFASGHPDYGTPDDAHYERFYTVFSLKNYKWEKSRYFPYQVSSNNYGIVVNGYLHWIVYPDSSDVCWSINRVIVYYDFVGDKFKEVPIPEKDVCGTYLFDQSLDRNFYLADLKGCLCICWHDNGHGQLKVWAMKEYGVNESWIPLVIIPVIKTMRRLKPLCFTKKGEVLVLDRSGLTLQVYNPKGNSFRLIDDLRSNPAKHFQHPVGLTAVAYMESLALPWGDSATN